MAKLTAKQTQANARLRAAKRRVSGKRGPNGTPPELPDNEAKRLVASWNVKEGTKRPQPAKYDGHGRRELRDRMTRRAWAAYN